MLKFLGISLLCLLCCTTLVETANAKLFFSLYATGGEHSFANEQNIDPGSITGFKLSLDLEGGKTDLDASLEGTYNQISAVNLLNGEPLDATVARVDIIYPLLKKTKWRPFLTVGLGRIFFDGDDNRPQDEDIVAYGAGLKYLMTEYLTLRAEGRRELLFNRELGNIDNYEYTASVGYTFGKRKPSKKKPKPKPEPKPEPTAEPVISDDDDLDGVKNPVDRCPGTPTGIKVDSSGCAEQTSGDPASLIEEIIPVDEPMPALVEKEIIVAAAPDKPAVLPEEQKTVVEQEDAPPAYVLPSLPTVIAFPALIPALPAVGIMALADALSGDEKAADKEATSPEVPAESTIIQTAPELPTPAIAPPVATVTDTPVSADSADPSAASAQESSTLSVSPQLPEPLPIPTIAVTTKQPVPTDVTTAPVTEPSAKEEPEILPAASSGELPTEQILAAAPTGPVEQPAPKEVPIAIPECSGLPPHAILMLGNSGSDLLHVPVDSIQSQPEPFIADAKVAKKSHVPTASFDFDVWLLSTEAQKVLSLLIQQLEASQLNYSIRVEGHTDSKGSDAYNYNLSLLRANAVATFLVEKKGLAPEKVSIAGCGEWKPLASNETDEGRKLNRRFELVILPIAEGQ